jgi:hypothetical protein
MTSKITKTLFLICLLSFLTNVAIADLDCGNETLGKDISNNIDETWTKEKVKNICGNPTKIKNWKETIITKYLNTNILTTINYSLWTYDTGSNRFIEYLLFKDEVLIDIKDGEYGSN